MSNLASQFEKTMMAHAFLECVDQLLTMAHASLVKDPRLVVTAIFQMWLQWFKTMGSGVEWPELATVERECCQLYEQYKGEEWVCPFDVHFALVNPSLEFLMDDLIVGMMVSAPAVASASNTAKHPQGGREECEMREMTPLATVTEVEWEASDMEVEGKEEFKATLATIEEDKEEECAEEGTWSDTPLCQIGNNKLKWLGKDLGWPMPLTSVVSLADFDERVAGVEWRFQRELEAAREELLAVQAHYTVAKQTLATLAGYQQDCQAFLAWQKENNIEEGNWEEAEDSVEVPDDDADLDS
ncbi:hypothetical protein E4T56_gene20331 [Termitomyces sp. T112]|nr:hypothetical protein E4T56_gene20331 [Termitomyces sp. T112]